MTIDYDAMSSIFQMSAGAMVISCLLGVLFIVSQWLLFNKAGEAGWAAIIPFYNLYVLFKITWGSGVKFLFLLIPIANVVIAIITWIKFAKAFDKGGGFACGLIFLPYIFFPTMAFSKNILYVGVPGK